MTTEVERPQPPRRAHTLVLPLVIIVIGFAVGALIPGPMGVLSGLIAAVATMGGMRLARIETTRGELVAVSVGVLAATVGTTVLLTEMSSSVTPVSTLALGGVWLVAGAGAGVLVGRLTRPTAGVNVALVWAAAGAVAVPMAIGLGFLDPGSVEGAGRSSIAAIVALIGGAATLSGATGVRGIGLSAAVLVITLFAAAQVGFSLTALIENLGRASEIPNFWPPDFSWAVGTGEWWWLPSWDFGSAVRASPIIETFRIAIIASLIGCLTALPVAFMASTITAPNRITYFLDKGFMNVIRTIPDLFWAMFFVAAVSTGPLAGVLALIFFSLAIMSKLLSETIDTVNPGPLEAARATGGSHFPAVRVSVLPQVLPNYVAYALYIFEINIRASVVIGLVGAGGIGRVLEAQRSFFRFDRVLAIVVVIFVIVFVVEQISVAFRRRLV